MKFNLCTSCRFFQPQLLTEEKRVPKSCLHENFTDLFGPDVGGFLSGIDIIHCDYHVQHDVDCGDVKYLASDGRSMSYVFTSKFQNARVPKLFNNIQNIKIIPHEKQRKSEIGITDCPF